VRCRSSQADKARLTKKKVAAMEGRRRVDV
jgi:hypothetical protein